jgi:type III secretion system needle length determinant
MQGVAADASPLQATAPQAASQGAAGVGMQDMIDSIRTTVELAMSAGSAQARIALQPAELGAIRIHLSQSAAGLLARITADTPAAAQALAQGRSELHESLSSLGVSLLRLDIGSSGQPQTGEGGGRFAGEPGPSGSSGEAACSSEGEGAEASADVGASQPPTRLGDGALVNVLA